MPIRRSSATCIRLIGASSAGGFVSSAPAACAKAAAGHIAPLCAACRMGDGTIKCGKRGATGGDASLVGLSLEQIVGMRTTHVVLAAAHLDHDPTNNRLRNLRSLCQRCHLIHDIIWRSGGSPICSAAPRATCFSGRTCANG